VSSDLPFPVLIATFVGYVLAGGMLVFGVIGVAVADEVGDPFGVGLLVLGAVIGLATVLLRRGNRVGRDVLGALAAITFVVAVVYAFSGPDYATGPGLGTVVATLGTIALLYFPQSSKDFFRRS
jgi:peptidoglycan/LPS O-acetylase OafA/YrhL